MNPSVLYVDDEEGNLDVFELAIGGRWPVLRARSGAEALDLLRQQGAEVAVLLTDQRMPGMSGTELMETVRVESPDTVRMMITAYSDLQAAIEAINRGQAQRYLKKPWDTAELRLVLGEAFESYLMHRRLKELEQRLVATERVYALGVVGAGVAHELRNPLTALSVGLEFFQSVLPQLSQGARPDLVKDVEQVVDDMELAVRAVTDIAESMALTTRSKAQGLVDLVEVVTLASRAVRGEARRRARLELDLQPVPRINGSRTRLGQVVLNLMVNALEAMDPGHAQKNLVQIRLRSSSGRVQLTIEDNGPGMAPHVAARIFDPFFTTKQEGGTGLGLAISRQIVEEHGGTLTVRSRQGESTTFVVDFPTAGAPGEGPHEATR